MRALRHVLVAAAAAVALAETRPETAEPPAPRSGAEETRPAVERRPTPENRPVRVILPSPYDRR